MAQIIYRNNDGVDVVIKNPTNSDMEKMWGTIAERIAPEVTARLLTDPQFLGAFQKYIAV